MDEQSRPGLESPRQLFVISGPSGVGKNTLARRLCGKGRAVRAVTATTRDPRPGEREGQDYYFVDTETFERWIGEGKLLEHTRYVGHYYGTPVRSVNEAAAREAPVILTIDVDGGVQIKQKWPQVTLIFVRPPSRDELRRRLKQRDSERDIDIEGRLRRAQEEYEYAQYYDFTVINDELDRAVEEIARIISSRYPAEQQRS